MRRSGVRFPKAAPLLKGPFRSWKGPFLLTGLLTAARAGRPEGDPAGGLGDADRLGEDVGGCDLGGADHVGVHAERDGGVGVAQPGRDDMNGDA